MVLALNRVANPADALTVMATGRYVESSRASLVASLILLAATSATVRARLLLSPAHSVEVQVRSSISAAS